MPGCSCPVNVRSSPKADAGLPLHLSRKRVPHVDAAGERVDPAAPNAYKLERFVFDALPLAVNPQVLAVDRDEEYAPIKNDEGGESPETARRALR